MCPTYHSVTFPLWVTSYFLSKASLHLAQQVRTSRRPWIVWLTEQWDSFIQGFLCVSGHQGNQCPAAVSYQVKFLDKNHHSALPGAVSTGTSSQELDHIVSCFPEHKSQKSVYYYFQLILSKFISSLDTCNLKIFCSVLSNLIFIRLIQ